jgi:predicted HTH domain antitoxin
MYTQGTRDVGEYMMKTQHKPQTQEEVLALFHKRKISTQKAAHLLGLSHGEFTRLASQHGIYTSTCYEPQPDLVEKIFGKNNL